MPDGKKLGWLCEGVGRKELMMGGQGSSLPMGTILVSGRLTSG